MSGEPRSRSPHRSVAGGSVPSVPVPIGARGDVAGSRSFINAVCAMEAASGDVVRGRAENHPLLYHAALLAELHPTSIFCRRVMLFEDEQKITLFCIKQHFLRSFTRWHDMDSLEGDPWCFKTVWKDIPSVWLASWLVTLPGGPSLVEIDMMHSMDPFVVRKLFSSITQLSDHDRIPISAMNQKVMRKLLTMRANEVGNRMQLLYRPMFCGDECEFFSPLFDLNFKGGRLSSIMHISGDVAVIPELVVITLDWALVLSYSDGQAKLEYQPRVFYIKTFFGPDAGPNRHRLNPGSPGQDSLNMCADQALKTVEFVQELSHRANIGNCGPHCGAIHPTHPHPVDVE